MKLKIVRGTNPVIKFKLQGTTLSAIYQRLEKTDSSYVTIRKNLEYGEHSLEEDELQIAIKETEEGAETSSATDLLGNTFTVGKDFAMLTLSREYTLKMLYDQYVLQFNLIDEAGRLFTHKPINIVVLFDIAKFSE